MVENAEEVYAELVEDSEEDWLYGLVAFAVLEERRIEWMQHCTAKTGVTPTADEIKSWYEQQPPGELLRMKGEAETALAQFAQRVEEELLARDQDDIRNGIIVSEIRQSSRFWPQFGVGVVASLVGALLFGAILAILAFFLLSGQPSIGDLTRGLGNNNDETSIEQESGSDE